MLNKVGEKQKSGWIFICTPLFVEMFRLINLFAGALEVG